jgi:protein-S-isoprenylcysteine O-methyltransferase Ste14
MFDAISSNLLWKTAFVSIWLAMAVIRWPYGKAHKAAPKKASLRPGLEAVLVGLNSLSMMVAPMVVVFSPWLDSFAMGLPQWARGLATVFFAADAVFFYWVHKTLGRNWSPVLDIKKEHRLVQEGPYRYIRHPMYTQIWVWVLTQGIVLDNWFLEVFGLLCWALLYFSRVPREERLMSDEFGQDYLAYCERTGRLLPRVLS